MKKVSAIFLIFSFAFFLTDCSKTTSTESKMINSVLESTDYSIYSEKKIYSSDLSTETLFESKTETLATTFSDSEEKSVIPDENDRILWEVFNSERQFIFSSGFSPDEEMNLKEYMEKTISGNQDGYIDIERYIFIDLDSDGHNELIVMIYHFTEEYLIFHVSGNDVYGYPEVQKGIEVLKTDGSIQSGGMSYFDCFTVSFENNVRTNTFFIRASEKPELYEVDGQPCSFDEVKEAYDKWKEIEDAEWVVLFHPDYSKYPNG